MVAPGRVQNSLSIYLFVLLLITGGIGCSDTTDNPSDEVNSFSSLQTLFQDPPAEYRSAPLWVWNDQVTKEKIGRQLQQFKKNGIGGVFVHPRPGLITPYLSDRWDELFQYTVEQGKELEMNVWIYDENSYPSGFAGGHVPAEMPESVNQGQGLTISRLQVLPDSVGKYYLVLKKTQNGFVNITEKTEQEQNIESTEYYLFEKAYYGSSPWFGGYSYVDLLLNGVTEKFISITMQGYKQEVGDELSKTVPGIFTDEPNISPPGGEKTIRWTPDLFEEFYNRWGYDLRENLPGLYEEVGNWRKVRHNYYSLLLDLFIERWSKPWYNYTEQHDLKWTGHYWEHGWPNPGHGGDNMAMYAWHQIPGIDILFNNYREDVDAQFGNVRSVKELSSVANQLGRNRALSETYGGGGWNLRFQDMKRIGDWAYVLGVNFLNQHLSYMTIKGARKRDYPPSYSYHEPWWEYYKTLGDYFGRLSLALSAGEQVNHILVIEPTTSAWMYYSPSVANKDFQQIGDTFQEFLVDMESSQVEYDLGSERIIRDQGSVEEGKFVVGERAYDLVVLPPGLKNLDQHTVVLIEQYLNNGGEILSFVSPPEYVNGAASNKMQMLQSNAGNQWQRAKTGGLSGNKLLAAENFYITRTNNSSGILFHRRMQLEDGQILFLVNTSEKEKAAGKVEMMGHSVKKLDLTSGNIRPYPSEVTGEKIHFSFNLPPVGSLLLYVGDELAGSTTKQQKNIRTEVLTSEKPLKVRRLKPNSLTLDYCDLMVGSQKLDNMYVIQAANRVFEYYGFSGNPWSRAVQYKRNILEKNDFSKQSDFEATFTFITDGLEESAKHSLQAVVERSRLWEISINGTQVEPVPDKWWLDRSFSLYNIGEHVREGENYLTVEASPMTVFSELEPIYILGDFTLKSFSRGWQIVPDGSLSPGKWSNQGMPFYSDGVSYTRNYQLVPAEDTQYIIRLNDWQGTVAAVQVNGKNAGIIGWPPYELDISKMVQDGENEITVIVYGSLKNLLGPHHKNPRRWIAGPWMFEVAPEHQPPGEAYDVIGYGLMQDFDLVKQNKTLSQQK